MNHPQDAPEPMRPSDMVILESALRKGWPIPEETLVANLRCVQAVLDDPHSGDRARLRANRILALVAELEGRAGKGN